MKKVLRWIEKNEFVVLVLLAVAVLRIPSLYEPYWYGDEGIYLVLGQALHAGEVWYRDIHDNKPPLLYLLAAVAQNVMWFRLILLLWSLASVWVVYLLLKKLVKNQWGVGIGLVAFTLLSCLPTLEGNIANAEIFMILPTTAAIWLMVKEKRKGRDFFVSGVLLALAFLFKVPALFDFVALGVWLVFFGGVNIRKNKDWLKDLVLLVFGFALVVAVSFFYYFLAGAGREYVAAAFAQNIGYLSSWRTGSITRSGVSTQSGLMIRGVILLVTTAVIWITNRATEPRKKLMLVWFAFALFGALLSERPYPHYLIQLLPPGAVLLGMCFERPRRKGWILGLGLLVTLTLVSVVRYQFYFYPVIGYYQNFFEYIVGKKDLRAYRNSFDSRVDRNYKVAEYVRLRTDKEDRIFVWGDEPFIYALAKRLPVGRYTVAYHVIDFEGKEETIRKIKEQEPVYIILPRTEKRPFLQLLDVLSSKYILATTVEDTLIFRLVSQKQEG